MAVRYRRGERTGSQIQERRAVAVRYRSGETIRYRSGEAVRYRSGEAVRYRSGEAVRYRSGERWQTDTISAIIPAHRERHKGRRAREMRTGRNGTKAWSSDETALHCAGAIRPVPAQ